MPTKLSRLLILFFVTLLPPGVRFALAQMDTSSVVARFADGMLEVPALRVDDSYFGIRLSLTSTEPIELSLADYAPRPAPLAAELSATFVDNRLYIPCLKYQGQHYVLALQLNQSSTEVSFDIVEAEQTPPCAEQLPGHLTFMSPHANPLSLVGDRVYVANTPAATVDVIDAVGNTVIDRIRVGIDPVSLALRPDGMELWVANHVSDSISVIDTNPSSASYHQVLASIQDLDQQTGASNFDEPVGIAFASNDKAYVALSSTDRIAVIDVVARRVSKHVAINAQDPRAIAVKNGRLYVLAFESNNKSELSGCFGTIDGNQCTFSLTEHVVNNNNVLSLNYDADIVKDPRVPDRDLFVFDTANEVSIDTVSAVGTLLYGLTVDSAGRVFVAQTDARNTANGKAGTQKHTLADLNNRAFLNQITMVDCGAAECTTPSLIDLEPRPPSHPAPGTALATPFAIQVSADDATLLVTAAGSNQLFTLDAASGTVLSRIQTGAVPRGIALQSNADGSPGRAWVLNVVDNSVSVVDSSSPAALRLLATVQLDDPTDPELKLGRAAFHDANASSTGTFSCESCHPDGHTDQLLWVLDGPQCTLAGCNQIPPRSTMPIRGLRDTAPFHWDGVPGDPFGGRNGQFPGGGIAPNCDRDIPESCTRHLIDGAMASTMCDQDNCVSNDEGKAGLLDGRHRDALAKFLLSVPHPPARERAYDDDLTDSARQGFDDFFIQDPPPGSVSPTCGSVGCHNMPFWAGTNIPGSGMDAPSFRSLQDRWLLLPQGRVNMWELVNRVLGRKGFDEFTLWNQIISGSTVAEWQMFVEASMGYPGAFARQLTLNEGSTTEVELPNALALLQALETAAAEESLLLQGEGIHLADGGWQALAVWYRDGQYRERDGELSFTRQQLLDQAASGELLLTLTGRLPTNVDYAHPQPALWTTQNPNLFSKIAFPRLPDNSVMRLKGRHIHPGASLFVNGRRVGGTVQCESGTLPNCDDEVVLLQLDELPAATGMHFLQVQTPGGLMSNEFLFFVI